METVNGFNPKAAFEAVIESDALKSKLARYEKALRFYAEPDHYVNVGDKSVIERDGGETAREALKEDGK